ncbi:hypothetical protein FKW77_003709 [Venturia effusa]|uniref:NmrA-like domain-containing protein n=1 Tax=Venturia effusa TaxID=50376 RepID=A0A517LPX1_9PEZI|nr:hypothetical protein FKW77_003709 [Venturia effusa]
MAQYASTQPSNYENHIQNIAIVGAGGRAGKYIVSAIQSNGRSQTITALTRKDSSNTFADGVKTAYIDYSDPATIVSALRGQDVLIITMNVMAAPDASKKLIEAAAEAGVKWILPNEWGADDSNEEAGKDVMIGAAKKADREFIESLGVSWIGIACGFWYEFSLGGGQERYGFDFTNKSVLFYDDGEAKIDTSTWAACGEAVGKLLALPILPEDEEDCKPTISGWTNDFVRVGSFDINQKDMFASVLRVTGDKESDWTIRYQPVVERFEQGRAELQKGDRMGFAQLLYARAFYPDGAGKHAGLDNEKLGLKHEKIDEATKFGIHLHESDHFEAERTAYSAGRAEKKD